MALPFQEFVMTLPMFVTGNRSLALFRAASVLCRASLGLFVHALAHPGRLASVSRSTGRVIPR